MKLFSCKPSAHLRRLFAGLLAGGLLAACGGGGGYGNSGNGYVAPGSGTVVVSLTDAPACGFDAVNVTIDKVRINQSATASETDAGWTDITLNPAQKINLLNLNNGILMTLGQTLLPAGHYSQLRLVLDANSSGALANSVVLSGTTAEISLDTPSAVQSGIKLVDQFDVAAGQRADVVLDFDACKSIVTKGNGGYALKPVITVVPSVQSGIDGFVNTALLGSHVIVSAQQSGVIVGSTAPNATTGEFFLGHLATGSYDVVITADGRATAVIAAVPIASSTSTTVVSSSASPLNMPVAAANDISGMATLTPASATEVATVSAMQTIGSGPTVTVKFANADAGTGAYTLHGLPIVAPQWTTYSATLPLSFAAAATVTPGVGKYNVQASAAGYTSSAMTTVDISAGSKTGINFNLIP